MNKRVTFFSPFTDDSKVEIETDFCQCELVSVGAVKYCPIHDNVVVQITLKHPWSDIVDVNKKVGD